MRTLITFLILSTAVFAGDDWEDQYGHYTLGCETKSYVLNGATILDGPDLDLQFKPPMGSGQGIMGAAEEDEERADSIAVDGVTQAISISIPEVSWTDIDGSVTNPFIRAASAIRITAKAKSGNPSITANGRGAAQSHTKRFIKNTGGQDQIFHGTVEFANDFTAEIAGTSTPDRAITMEAYVGTSYVKVIYQPLESSNKRWKIIEYNQTSTGTQLSQTTTEQASFPTQPFQLYRKVIANGALSVRCTCSTSVDPRSNNYWKTKNFLYVHVQPNNLTGIDDERDDTWRNAVKITMNETIDEH